jgi:hypothetical protein
MRSPLSAAFTVGVAPIHYIANLYDRVGFLAMRSLIDDEFVMVKQDEIASPRLRKAAELFNNHGGMLQEKLFKGIADTYAGGNLAPKPDIKKPLLKLGETLLTSLPRMNIGQAAILTLGIGVGMAALYLGNNTGFGQSIPDAFSTYLGLKPDAAPIPRQDAL